MIRNERSFFGGLALCVLAASVAVGCGSESSTERSATNGTGVAFSEATELNVKLNRRVSSTIDLANHEGARTREVQAFVTLADDGETGLLYVRVDDGKPVAIDDPVAIPVLDAETPPQVVVGSDDVIHLAYAASESVKEKWNTMAVRYIRSEDGGTTWTDPVNAGGVTFGGYRNDHELHVADDGRVYVAWLDSNFSDEYSSDIHVAISSSADGGKTWSDVALVDEKRSCECCRVAIATTSGGEVFVAWRKIFDGGIRDIAIASSSDYGLTWSEPTRVFADEWEMDHCPDAGPSLVVGSSDNLHIAWWTGKPGAAGVKYARALNGSTMFETPVTLKVDEMSRSSHVQLAVGGGDSDSASELVAVTWDDGALQTPQIVVRVSHDGGDTFDELQYLSDSPSAASYPTVDIGPADKLVIGWHTRGSGETMVREADPGAALWGTPSGQGAPSILVKRGEL